MINDGLKPTVQNVSRYRGGWGQWAWLAHRLAGLGVVVFLALHVIDTSTVFFAPNVYAWFTDLYKTPLFGLGEVALAGALIYHALNGLKIVVLDFAPRLWPYHNKAQVVVWVLFVLTFIPVGGIMLVRIINHTF